MDHTCGEGMYKCSFVIFFAIKFQINLFVQAISRILTTLTEKHLERECVGVASPP